ncbi:MAG: M81 family metallopeptidase [Pararhodobacter sp.]|nr:M81 family metallopeptidase [Pararhodobacter sp.]
MKILIASIFHETNTFSPIRCDIRDFTIGFTLDGSGSVNGQNGATVIERMRGTNTALSAFIAACEAAEADIVLPFCGTALPSGPCDAASFQAMCARILADLDDSVDGVMLDMHGAMVAEGADDAEGTLLAMIRQKRPGIPIAVALDFHATISRQTVANADIITGYWTVPHVDMYETGQRAARSLLARLRGQAQPVIAVEWLPMLPATTTCTPAREPLRSIMDRAITAEKSGEVMNASIFGGFPLSDVAHAGACVIIVDQDAGAAQALARELAKSLWDAREAFVQTPEPFETVIARAVELQQHPVVVADPGNNAGSGGTADTPAVLEALLNAGVDGILAGPVWDPESVQVMIAAGLGAEVEIVLGSKVDLGVAGHPARPLPLKGRVIAMSDGWFTITGPMLTGMRVCMGPTAVLELPQGQVVVSSNRIEPLDQGVFTHCGLDPRAARYIALASRQHFRAGFEQIAAHILLAEGPGVCRSDLSTLRFNKLIRPVFPLDRNVTWAPGAPAEDVPPGDGPLLCAAL